MKPITCVFAVALLAIPTIAMAERKSPAPAPDSRNGPPAIAQGAGRRQALRAGPAHAHPGRQEPAGRVRIRAGPSAEQGREAITPR